MKPHLAIFAILTVILTVAMARSATAQSSYDVRNVASDDVLNMRAHVDATKDITSIPVVGRIPWNARKLIGTGNTAQVGSSTWIELSYRGITGWVTGQFLSRIDDVSGSKDTDYLKCGGAEPFWSLVVRENNAVFEDPFVEGGKSVKRFRITKKTFARGRPQTFVAYLATRVGKGRAFATFIRTGQCSDGMSDNIFPYELMFVDREDPKGVWSGCCSTDR